MTESNLEAIQRELKLRELRRTGQKLLKGQERYDFIGIREKHDRARDETEELYRKEYRMRTDVAYQMLLRKAGALKPALKPRRFGIDRFNTNRLLNAAQQLVRFEHDRTMKRLDEREIADSTAFLEKCSQRKDYLEAFKQSADRRTQERRHGPQRGPSPTMSD